MKSLSDFFQKFTGITVYALVGESGTGKSFRAKLLAQKYGLTAIIDDGLLIQDDKILAGHSAKREKTYMGAVRVALFDDKEHRDEIAKMLHKLRIKKILLLGTSEKMVIKIATRLQLPPPSKIIKIEDIASREEIEKAIRSRQIEGKHIIPVPAIEIKRNYPQIFYNSIKVFFNRKNIFHKKEDSALQPFEKSVVRPEFSKKGRISISEAALTQMAMHCVSECDPKIRVKKFTIKTDSRGYRFIITIDVPFGNQLTGKIHALQQYVIDNIERYTGILVEEVSIIIDKITGTENI
ncbi:hypothetical protein HRQ91_05905 [Treponema parvum]|uniref:Asp23/Gls24 family envelope stress response protein n=1 Tax=Treponema parvum TaxID=138851 RepID=A0A975IF73_9SPIR|nr:hypothetical protein [Treponema parvum]QTQ14024.1 hypothetical protein HRQ91_05905 [Treponema parvum]